MRIRIGERWAGEGEHTYVVAEAGSNHDGDLDRALELIDVAAEAGADAAKFQTFRAATLYPRSAGTSDYLGRSQSIYEIIRGLEMPYEWIPRLAARCAERGIAFLSTPFDEASADALAGHVPAFKIASYEMTHHPLIAHVARMGKPLIISTGTADLSEVEETVEVVHSNGAPPLVLMQCTAAYPAPLDALNVRAMVTLRERFDTLVGLSDHSREALPGPLAAVALGASVIEKHFTLDNRLPGPDHAYALEPAELAALVRAVREVEQVLGSGRKEPLPTELELRAFARRSIFTLRAIHAGEPLTRENIAVLRCGKLGFGMRPSEYALLLDRSAARDLEAETAIRPQDVV